METTLIRPTKTVAEMRWIELQSRIQGTVITPDNPQYDQARQAWNLTVDHRPAVIVIVVGRADDAVSGRLDGDVQSLARRKLDRLYYIRCLRRDDDRCRALVNA